MSQHNVVSLSRISRPRTSAVTQSPVIVESAKPRSESPYFIPRNFIATRLCLQCKCVQTRKYDNERSVLFISRFLYIHGIRVFRSRVWRNFFFFLEQAKINKSYNVHLKIAGERSLSVGKVSPSENVSRRLRSPSCSSIDDLN